MTRDHIVPRNIRKTRESYDGISVTVDCCYPCNTYKGNSRSTCDCGVCSRSWSVLGPDGYESLPRVDVAALSARKRRNLLMARM